jgi:hypothetical protein
VRRPASCGEPGAGQGQDSQEQQWRRQLHLLGASLDRVPGQQADADEQSRRQTVGDASAGVGGFDSHPHAADRRACQEHRVRLTVDACRPAGGEAEQRRDDESDGDHQELLARDEERRFLGGRTIVGEVPSHGYGFSLW